MSICSGDSSLIHDFYQGENVFEDLLGEVDWGEMTICGNVLCRKGCFQGDIDKEGNVPWLRCPSIEGQTILPWTPTVEKIRNKINEEFGVNVNIAKIQLYKDGKAFIKSHADKIIDLKEDVPIFNYRVGATRNFVMTNKVDKSKQVYPMINNSLFVLGPLSNIEWRHAIEKEEDVGPSISIIFRESVTFKRKDGLFFGPRTLYKTNMELERALENNSVPDVMSAEEYKKELIRAFGIENKNPVTLEVYETVINNTL